MIRLAKYYCAHENFNRLSAFSAHICILYMCVCVCLAACTCTDFNGLLFIKREREEGGRERERNDELMCPIGKR